MNKHNLKKREQYYLIEKEKERVHAFSHTGAALSTSKWHSEPNDFARLLREYPKINYNDRSIRKLLDHLYFQLRNLDVPLSDTKLRKMVEDYLKILQTNSKVDCTKYSYVPVGVLPKPKKLVIIGDLHADYCVTLNCLKLAGVIPHTITAHTPISKIKSIAEPGTIVVQLGDQIDGDGRGIGKWKQPECQSFLRINKLFDHLNRVRNNKVLILSVYGNHELTNLSNNFKYIPGRHLSKTEASEIKSYGLSQMRNDIICTRRPFWVVGDWLLVHGGVTDKWFKSFGGPMIHAGNPEFSSEIANAAIQNYYALGQESGKMSKHILDSLDDPLWNRSYGHTGSCAKVPKSLKRVVKKIAVSHTVQENYAITKSNCGGTKIFRLDTGMSRAFGRLGNPAVLIEKNEKIYTLELQGNGSVTSKLF